MLDKLIQKIDEIDVASLLEEYRALEKSVHWTQFNIKGSRQAGIQHIEGEDPWTSAVGRSRGLDLTCDKINPFFENSLTAQTIDKYNLKRSRLMWVGTFACYTMHRDPSKRVHIPLVTNPDCYFVFKDYPPFYLEPGYVWLVDTTEAHTFMNCSAQERLHIVGAI